MLKLVRITYSVRFHADVVVQAFDRTDKELIEAAADEVDIPEGGTHNSVYVDDSFDLIEGSVENA